MEMDKTNTRQMQAFELVKNTNQSFFLTGKAGTGKTTFVKKIQEEVDKQFIVVAPTGIAAIVAGGVTIHSFFGLDLNVQGPKDHGKNLTEDKISAIRSCDTIIIDEVSMVRCDIVDSVDRTLRLVMRSPLPFGGKQMLFVGDMFQLPPVLRSGAEMDAMLAYYGSDVPFFYKAHVFDNMTLPTIEFEKVYRQSDESFLNILNDIRSGVNTMQNLEVLNSRFMEPELSEGPVITLTPFRDTAQKINSARLDALPGDMFTYEGTIDGKFGKTDKDGNVKEDNLPAPMKLILKTGAQVMFTRNDPSHRWFNGTIGTVTDLSEKDITVKIGDSEYSIAPMTWESYEYEFDKASKKLSKEMVGAFSQYPLRLAWAITIHKSQGLTFDRMILDLSRGTFAAGQLYVALSRVRSLDGLYLSRPVKPTDIKKDDEVIAFASGYNDDAVIDSQIAEGKALYPYIKSNDYDGAVMKYMELAKNAIRCSQLKSASILFKQMFTIMVSDEGLYGACDDIAEVEGKGQIASFVNAVLCLYGGRPEKAIQYCDGILKSRPLYEALFIKARALSALGNMHDADDVNVRMSEVLNPENGGDGYDMKFIFSLARVNQSIGDPCLDLYQRIVLTRPDYMPAHRWFFEAMHVQGHLLTVAQNVTLPEIAVKFNEESDSKSFMEYLKSMSHDNPAEFDKYNGVIAKQCL